MTSCVAFSESSVRAFAHAAAIAPIDFSPSALQALGFALDLARQADGRVTLLHVVEWLAEEEPRASTHFSVPEYRRYMVEDAQERLRNLVAEEPRTLERRVPSRSATRIGSDWSTRNRCLQTAATVHAHK